ncbi:MAG: sulfatase-like hydrolase/transferase [Bacteroidetes bacterium]|nr:sulfatase-like hydrolase/transferase [Bacteroidota bacterium]
MHFSILLLCTITNHSRCFFPLAPHTPNTPRATDASLYHDEIPPFPENFYAYDLLYPEFYNESGSIWVKDTIATKEFIKDRFSCLIGLDENINKIFNRLDTTHVTDSTFILYTSDNGYINGEHMMRAKALPIDESIHVPLLFDIHHGLAIRQLLMMILLN